MKVSKAGESFLDEGGETLESFGTSHRQPAVLGTADATGEKLLYVGDGFLRDFVPYTTLRRGYAGARGPFFLPIGDSLAIFCIEVPGSAFRLPIMVQKNSQLLAVSAIVLLHEQPLFALGGTEKFCSRHYELAGERHFERDFIFTGDLLDERLLAEIVWLHHDQ